MFQLINNILTMFRQCFKRERTWNWFVCTVMAFIVRSERRGVTTVISTLRLCPWLYETLLHFFRSKAYRLNEIYARWVNIVQTSITLYEQDGHVILIGDHIKVSKEGRRMPRVRTYHQESDNSGKPEYIEGHNYGFISALATDGTTYRNIPLMAEMQESKSKTGGASLVEQVVGCGGRLIKSLKKPVTLVLDAYFCSSMTFITSDHFKDDCGNRMLEIVTRAKTDTVAYTSPVSVCKPTKRGRPRIYGEKVKLQSLFVSESSSFTETELVLYGKKEKVRYLCRDLIWKPCQRPIRFVLAEMGGNRVIFMSSDTGMSPESILMLYGFRFKIETGFNELKNEIGCFDYRFWTKSLPKKKKWKDIELPTDSIARNNISKAIQAIETHVCLACIASGILTIIGFRHNRNIWDSFIGWLRTVRNDIPSIATTRQVISQELTASLPLLSDLPVFRCILRKQRIKNFIYRLAS